MTNEQERVWAYLLKNRQATVEDVVLNCDVTLELAEGCIERIASDNWREELLTIEGVKHDGGKLRMELIPPELLEETARVLTFGAEKYADRNWELGMKWSRPFGAMMRHMWAWWKGEKSDPETGYSHLSHAACCLAFLIAYEARGSGMDDRP